MIEIIPAILAKSFADLKRQAELVRGSARLAQVDIVGKKIIVGEEKMPFWGEMDYEFDLMIKNPKDMALECVAIGAARLVLHEKSEGLRETLKALSNFRGGGDTRVQVGLALAPTGDPYILQTFEEQFDFAQVMGIEKEGKQGEPFDKRAIYLIERIKRMYPKIQIQVDGGVKIENARALAQAGANRLVVGSAIFGSGDPKAAMEALYTEANA